MPSPIPSIKFLLPSFIGAMLLSSLLFGGITVLAVMPLRSQVAELHEELLQQNQITVVRQAQLDTMQQSVKHVETAVNAVVDGVYSVDAKTIQRLAESMAEIRQYSLGAACEGALIVSILIGVDQNEVFQTFTRRPGADCVPGDRTPTRQN